MLPAFGMAEATLAVTMKPVREIFHPIKVDAVATRGAEVVLHGDSYSDAYAHAMRLKRARRLSWRQLACRPAKRLIQTPWNRSIRASYEPAKSALLHPANDPGRHPRGGRC